MITQLPDYKRKALEQRRADLIEEYEAVTSQFGRTEGDVAQKKLERQQKYLEQQIGEIDEQLSAVEPAAVLPRSSLPSRIDIQFVNRPEPLAEIVASLNSLTPAIVIWGLGGMGKTTLAREVAQACIDCRPGFPEFEAAVWIDAGNPLGTTDLQTILYADAFRSPGSSQPSEDEQRKIVENLMRQQKILLVVDNFEKVSDTTLLNWLLCLPAPSKALIISREERDEYRHAVVIEFGGLNQEESFQFIRLQLQSSRTRRQAQDLDQFLPLISETGGNPKVLDVCLGLILGAHRTIEQAVNDLRSGRVDEMNGILGQAWSLLDETAKKIVSSATFFPIGVSEEALGKMVEPAEEGRVTALERLTKLKLLDVQLSSFTQQRRFSVHPLVKAFIQHKLESQPQTERALRVSWLEWAKLTATTLGGWDWQDPKRLEGLIPEEESLFAAISWAAEQPADDKFAWETVKVIANGLDHFYYVRGLWDRKERVAEMWIQAAQALGDPQEEARVVAQHVQVLCRRGDVKQVDTYLSQLREVERRAETLSPDVRTQVEHAYAFQQLAVGAYDRAYEILEQCRRLDQQPSANLAVATLHLIATCYYRQQRYSEAKPAFTEALGQAENIKYQRSAIYCKLHLAKIAIEEDELSSAADQLAECLGQATYLGDLRYIAQIEVTYARLYARWKNYPSARFALTKAEQDYRLMGLKDDLESLAKAQQEVDALQWVFVRVLERISLGSSRVLMLDYDGTLAPFVEKRNEAIPYPGVCEVLAAIQTSGRTRLVIVSGRAIKDLKPLLKLDPLPEIWGSHGWERLLPDGTFQGPQVDEGVKECLAEAQRVVLAAGWEFIQDDFDVKPEQQPVSLALHWRRRDPRVIAALEREVRELWEPLAQSANLVLRAFDRGLELGLPGKDKGSAVRTILSEANTDAIAAYLGDDQTDEDAFKTIKGRGYGILVRPEYRPTAAAFWLKPPEELLEFLKHWA